MDRILSLFRFAEVRAESEKKTAESEKSAGLNWPRLLSFNPLSDDCDDDDNEDEETCTVTMPLNLMEVCEGEKEENKKPEPKSCGKFSKRLGCMSKGAKNGLRDGALTGVFFGGGYGMYKYFTEGGGKEGGESSEDSTTNDNIIFVWAANGAIAMAVFCTLFCSTKAMIFCS